MQTIDKNLLVLRFKKSINTYNENAVIQRKMASKLLELISHFSGDQQLERVLDLGCGTGFLTENFLKEFKAKQVMANDIVDEFKGYIEKICLNYNIDSFDFLSGDIEEIEFPSRLHLIMSNAAIQWLEDFPNFVEKAYNAMMKNGLLAVTTFGTENFKEIKALTNSTLSYLDESIIEKYLSEKFKPLYIKTEKEVLYFNHPMEVLTHIKLTGVAGTGKINWTKEMFNDFSNAYERLFGNKNGIPLTYNPIYIIATKES